MASLGRAIASGVTNIAELSPNLVNLNFNFTLYKVEAPAEFQGVGRALTNLRRAEAEEGRPHVTARSLGALFASIVPKTPKLLSLYGMRASEISQAAEINPSHSKDYGFFSNRAGADATTIWASATSGPGAIAVHLLACILARIWDPSEATSIWMEIVKQRSESILNDFEEGNVAAFADIAAAKNTLTPQPLAEWDNSARAWLRAADRVKAFEQKQLMLILDNIHQKVDGSHGTYNSVIKAWQDSLTAFEALLNGVSQKAKTGEVLLALSALHLYPDIMVVEPSPNIVKQKDHLLASCGIFTLGLHRAEEEQPRGVCWSLPLAQLRHYGPPVNRERIVNSTQRLTVDEYSQVLLGAFLHGWGDRGRDTIPMLRWFQNVHQAMLAPVAENMDSKSIDLTAEMMGSWLGILFDTSKICLQALEAGDDNVKQVLRLGRRYSGSLALPSSSPHFGLSESGRFVSCTKSDDDGVEILLAVAAKLPGDPAQLFIRVRHSMFLGTGSFYEYATAKPFERPTCKRYNDGSRRPSYSHYRWLWNEYNFEYCHAGADMSPESNDCSTFSPKSNEYVADHCLETIVKSSFTERSQRYRRQGEIVLKREEAFINDTRAEDLGISWPHYGDFTTEPDITTSIYRFKMIYGDEKVALFADRQHLTLSDAARALSLSDFHTFFDAYSFDPRGIRFAICQELASKDLKDNRRNYWAPLQAISSLIYMYRNMTLATIDVRVLEYDISSLSNLCVRGNYGTRNQHEPHDKTDEDFKAAATQPMKLWTGKMDTSTCLWALNPLKIDLKAAFSCICFFESGRFRISSSNLHNVMAMCSNDLIWVASSLVNDPATGSQLDGSSLIRALPGNIGRSGIAFLVPPADPMIRPTSIQDFRDVVHRPFEGHLQNNFQTTSLHLSFTTAQSPIGENFTGMKDDEVYLLETLLSVHEGGQWVADLDLLKSYSSPFQRICRPCQEHANLENDDIFRDISCIDNWAELLEAPDETAMGIVRACGDWQARLATFAVAVAMEWHVMVLPSTICWDCVRKSLRKGPNILIA